MKLNDVDKFLLADMRKNGCQNSWDWGADKRFAERFVPDCVDDINRILHSQAPFPIVINGHSALIRKPVTKKRLMGLRSLVKQGLVKSFWVGLGEGGVAAFGVNKVKGYKLITDPKRQEKAVK